MDFQPVPLVWVCLKIKSPFKKMPFRYHQLQITSQISGDVKSFKEKNPLGVNTQKYSNLKKKTLPSPFQNIYSCVNKTSTQPDFLTKHMFWGVSTFILGGLPWEMTTTENNSNLQGWCSRHEIRCLKVSILGASGGFPGGQLSWTSPQQTPLLGGLATMVQKSQLEGDPTTPGLGESPWFLTILTSHEMILQVPSGKTKILLMVQKSGKRTSWAIGI